ncbi:MFS transporter [Paraburkholderia sacchari]|nr:MFS transporter [Paraburkholderia sacchari]
MRPVSALFMLIGVLLASGGYGATFLLSMHIRSIGGNDFTTGVSLAGAVFGTFVGVSFAGWVAPRVGAARIAAFAALCVGAGVAGFAILERVIMAGVIPGALLGFGWGAFYLAAPMSLVERTDDAGRRRWFLRFGTFQMAGIGGCPALAAYAIRYGHVSLGSVLYVIVALCAAGALMIEVFGRLTPCAPRSPSQERWLRNIAAISRTRAIYSIAIIALGACVFSGLMTFQMSLMQGTRAHAGTFFSLYTVTVVATRWLLSRFVVVVRAETATKVLLAMMVLGSAAMFAVPYHALFQLAAAILLGTGYGLAYPIVQSQAVNDATASYRHAALTWFVVAYFVGIFGFPSIGGWVLVHNGKGALLALISACALIALVLAILQDRPRAGTVSAKA